MTELEFEARLWLSSVQLVRVGDQNLPTSIASGALVDYGGKRLLFTVEHATGDQARWAIQMRYVPERNETEHYPLGEMNFLERSSLSATETKTVDFAYVEVPEDLIVLRQEVSPSGKIIGERPTTVHSLTLTEVPAASETYGFCGMVLPEIEQHSDRTFFTGEIRIYSGLKFTRTEDDFHYFCLPFAHPGHEDFKGCSGAPILSEKGALVGLVSGGDVSTNEIRALSLSDYKTAIDILVGNIR